MLARPDARPVRSPSPHAGRPAGFAQPGVLRGQLRVSRQAEAGPDDHQDSLSRYQRTVLSSPSVKSNAGLKPSFVSFPVSTEYRRS
jgi:hypothetical protein